MATAEGHFDEEWSQTADSLHALDKGASPTHSRVKSLLNSVKDPLCVGSLVAYELLGKASKRRWFLGRVLQLDSRSATVRVLLPQNSHDPAVLNTLRIDKERKMEEMRHRHMSVMALREEMAAVRRNNEAAMGRAKESSDAVRRAIAAVEEVRLHEVFNTRVPSVQLRLALEATVALLNEDLVVDSSWSWEDLRAAVRDPTYIQRLLEFDPMTDMSVELYNDINDAYMSDVHLYCNQLSGKTTGGSRSGTDTLLPLLFDWIIAQMGMFHVICEIVNSQRSTDELHANITSHIAHIKELNTQIKRIETKLHCSAEEGSSVDDGACEDESEQYLTFVASADRPSTNVSRSCILTVLSISDDNGDVVSITDKDVQFIDWCATIHRPLLHVALHHALEGGFSCGGLQPKDEAVDSQPRQNSTDIAHEENSDLLQQIEEAQRVNSELQQLLNEQRELAEKTRQEGIIKISELKQRHDEDLRQLEHYRKEIEELQRESSGDQIRGYDATDQGVSEHESPLHASTRGGSREGYIIEGHKDQHGERVTTTLKKNIDLREWRTHIINNREDINKAVLVDAARACQVDISDIDDICFNEYYTSVVFTVSHPPSVLQYDLAQRVRRAEFLSVLQLMQTIGKQGESDPHQHSNRGRREGDHQDSPSYSHSLHETLDDGDLFMSTREEIAQIEELRGHIKALEERLRILNDENTLLRRTKENKEEVIQTKTEDAKDAGYLLEKETSEEETTRTNTSVESAEECQTRETYRKEAPTENSKLHEPDESLRDHDKDNICNIRAHRQKQQETEEPLNKESLEESKAVRIKEDKQGQHNPIRSHQQIIGQLIEKEELHCIREAASGDVELQGYVHEMEEQLAELRAENEELRNTDGDKARELDVQNEKLHEMEEQLAELRAENEELRNTDGDKARELDVQNEKLHEMEEQLAELRAENEELRRSNELFSLRNDYCDVSRDAKDGAVKIYSGDEYLLKEKSADVDCSGDGDGIGIIKNELILVKRENIDLRSVDDENSKEIECLLSDVKELRLKLSEISSENDELRKELDIKSHELVVQGELLQELGDRLKEFLTQNEQLRGTDELRVDELDKQQRRLRDMEEQVMELQAVNERKTNELVSQSDGIRKAVDALKKLRSGVDVVDASSHNDPPSVLMSNALDDLEEALNEPSRGGEEERKHDSRWMASMEGDCMVSSQCVQLQGERLDELLKNKPEELRCAVVVDAANACRVYRDCVSNVTFTPSGRVVEFDVTHPSSIHPSEIAQRLQHYPFRETQRLLLGSSIGTNDAGDGNLTMSSFLRRACGVMVDEQGVFVDEVLSRLVIERSSLSSLQCLLVVGFLNRDRIRAKREGDLLDELEERATEHTEMLENMEEMVVLLDEARQAECTVRSELFAREEELLELRCTQDRDKKFRDEMLLSLFNMLEKARSSHVEVARGKVEELMSGVYLVGELEQEVKKLSEENAALREELEQRETTHKEDLDALNRKIAALLLELDEKGFEYTDTIGKLDEFVNVLEGARAAEKAALMALEAREQELFDLQDAKDDEMREVEAVMQQLEARIEELQGGMPVPLPWTSSEHLGETGNSITSAVTVPSASNLAVGGTDIISSMRHQLERLKREKEALMVELQSKGRQHDDVVDELNRNIGGLMTDLDSRIRGCQVSATSAKELLREISLLRSVEEGEDDEDEGDATGCPTTHLGGPWAHH